MLIMLFIMNHINKTLTGVLWQLAGSLKGVVYCRGPLDSPIFEGSVETTGRNMCLTYDTCPSAAIDAIRSNLERGAVAAYDHVPFVSGSGSFTFNTDNCVSFCMRYPLGH
jgi:hypothetical protein